jgi:hypothetical protein
VHAGNPAEDLGWLCVKAWRFGVDAPVAGLGTREELLAAYRAAGGAGISVAELRWWEILGTLRWGAICMKQTWTHLHGAHRSVELAAIGRRVCEQEWDLLLLLAPAAAAQAAVRRPRPAGTPQPSPAPHGRPTASELLDAVRGFLTDDVIIATTGQVAFHARVAANVLGIVAREIELGPVPPETGPSPGPTQTDPTQTDPTQTDPTQTDPTDTDPGPDPVQTEPNPDPTDPDQTQTDLCPGPTEIELARGVAARLAVANPRYFEPIPADRTDI